MSEDKKLEKVAEGEYHPCGRLCTTDKYGHDCEYYEFNGNMATARYHTCGSCTYFGVVGTVDLGCRGNACLNDNNNKTE